MLSSRSTKCSIVPPTKLLSSHGYTEMICNVGSGCAFSCLTCSLQEEEGPRRSRDGPGPWLELWEETPAPPLPGPQLCLLAGAIFCPCSVMGVTSDTGTVERCSCACVRVCVYVLQASEHHGCLWLVSLNGFILKHREQPQCWDNCV